VRTPKPLKTTLEGSVRDLSRGWLTDDYPAVVGFLDVEKDGKTFVVRLVLPGVDLSAFENLEAQYGAIHRLSVVGEWVESIAKDRMAPNEELFQVTGWEPEFRQRSLLGGEELTKEFKIEQEEVV